MPLPIPRLRDTDWRPVAAALEKLFAEVLFGPVNDVLKKRDLKVQAYASGGALIAALRSGRVSYKADDQGNGVFEGQFSAAIGKELRELGAVYFEGRKVFRLALSRVPAWVHLEAAVRQEDDKDLHEELLGRLNSSLNDIEDRIAGAELGAEQTVGSVARGFKPMAIAIAVPPDLSENSQEELARAYTRNLKPYVVDFAREEIKAMRAAVEANALAGYRSAGLIDKLRARYDVTRNKAKFLARQETALFVSKYQELKYAEAGVDSYTWQTSGDARVRPSHKALNGKPFFFKDPPLVEGRPLNPGQDFGCRCVARPKLTSLAFRRAA